MIKLSEWYGETNRRMIEHSKEKNVAKDSHSNSVIAKTRIGWCHKNLFSRKFGRRHLPEKAGITGNAAEDSKRWESIQTKTLK